MPPDAQDEIYEAAKKPEWDIPALRKLDSETLRRMALEDSLALPPGLTKQELIYELLKAKVTRTGLGWGEGVLDVLPDGFGFLRSPLYDYLAGPDDIYVSPSQIRRLNLRPGHLLAGPVRPPKGGEKYFALLHVEAVDGGSIKDLRTRTRFDELVPVLPAERLRLEHPGCALDMRLMDLLAPIGKGQRVLIKAPLHSGRPPILTHMAQALHANHPDLCIVVCLIDERPEDVTELRKELGVGPGTQNGHNLEVVSTSFEESAERHSGVAEMALARCQRLVECGRDVVLIFDSLTQYVRAQNEVVPPTGRVLRAGLDIKALEKPKALFAAAKAIDGAGSLTVIATALHGTGSAINDAVLEEFTHRSNSIVTISPDLAELHVRPGYDIAQTGTRREDNLLEEPDVQRLRELRAELDRMVATGDTPRDGQRIAHDELVRRIQDAPDNRTFLDGLPSGG